MAEKGMVRCKEAVSFPKGLPNTITYNQPKFNF